MRKFEVRQIGTIINGEDGAAIELAEEYRPALKGLDGFGYINVIWWFSELDQEEARAVLQTPKPYRNAPDRMGIFATRSPVRPNPIALTAVQVLHIDYEAGRIQIAYTDAYDGSPVLDIKPYTPSIDRVKEPEVPKWCAHWPICVEESGDFDWANEFCF